jgi:RNA-directed DNA polymerase
MKEEYGTGQMDADQVRTSIQSWIAHASHGDTYHLRQRIFAGATFSHPCDGGL